MLFDTLKLSDALETAFTPEQARVLTKAFVDAGSDQLVTKADLAMELTQLRAEIKNQFSEVRNDFSLLRTDMVRWVVGAVVFNVFAVAGLIIALGRLGH